MTEVFVIDRVVTAPGCAHALLDAYLSGYAPGARERGMTLRDVLVSPPILFDDRSNTVTITWSLPSPLAWWQMTWRGRPDPAVARWWQTITELVVERSREVATAMSDVDEPADSAGPQFTSGEESLCVTRLIDVAEPERDRVLTALRAAALSCGAATSVVEPTLSGSRNGGDILAHLRFADHNAWETSGFDDALIDPAISHVNGVSYRGAPTVRGRGTVYRTLDRKSVV